MIPRQYTCDAADVSPPISWSGWPEQAQSFVLLCEDPDAKKGAFTHWIAWNIPLHTPELPERVAPDGMLPTGAVQGTNDFGKLGYGGPCPPPGSTHRYIFKIYALDTMLKLSAGATRAQLFEVMQGHRLAEGQLMAKYQREASPAAR
jgi:Raf kinase inhibitor-like YbhB/YbcL family protein